jgi:hypothetical protein
MFGFFKKKAPEVEIAAVEVSVVETPVVSSVESVEPLVEAAVNEGFEPTTLVAETLASSFDRRFGQNARQSWKIIGRCFWWGQN